MAVVTIDCQTPWDDHAVMQALVIAKSNHSFDAGQQALIDKLIEGMGYKISPPRYQRPEAGTFVGGGLVARPQAE